jgi:hypothetical protein
MVCEFIGYVHLDFTKLWLTIEIKLTWLLFVCRYLMDVAVGEEFEMIRRYWRSPEGQAQLVPNVEEGLKKVRDSDSNYIFLMESLSAKFHTNRRPCDLTTVGEPFGSRSYGFAVPRGLPPGWSDELHRAILELMEAGEKVRSAKSIRLYLAIAMNGWKFECKLLAQSRLYSDDGSY